MSVEKEWFASVAEVNFMNFLPPHFTDKKHSRNLLQIGAYTGDASLWLANNILKLSDEYALWDVDTWEGSPEKEHEDLNWSEVEESYDSKISKSTCGNQVFKYKTDSDTFFKNLDANIKFDFIYVDGHHYANFVARDAFNSYIHLADEGILAFDDYGYGQDLLDFEKPKIAIDFFLEAYSQEIEILTKDYQVWVRKKS